jgi:hypothetical protein
MLGTFIGQAKDPETDKESPVQYIVTKINHLNLLGRKGIQALGISVDKAM